MFYIIKTILIFNKNEVFYRSKAFYLCKRYTISIYSLHFCLLWLYSVLKTLKYHHLNRTVTNKDRCQRNSILQIIQTLLLLPPPPQPIQAFQITLILILTTIPMISKNQSTGLLMRQRKTLKDQ
jgi:hypothetical protein